MSEKKIEKVEKKPKVVVEKAKPAVDKPKVVVDKPRAEPARPGRLFVDARPWATIYLDGAKIGVTPIVGRSVPAGEHTIKAVAEDGSVKTLRVTVEAGGDLRRRVIW